MSLPTVKLTLQEWIALAKEIESTLGMAAGVAAVTEALGADKAGKLIAEALALYDRDGDNMSFHSDPLTKRENHALVKAFYSRIPGETRQQKIDWAYEHGRKCFASDERFQQVLDYCYDRIAAFGAKGGTIDRYPVELGPVGYGRVNYATSEWAKTEADIRRCADKGVKIYAWEMAGFGQSEIWNAPEKLAAACEVSERIVKLCRELGMIAFPSVLNWNMSLTKYHHTSIRLETVRDQAEQLVRTLKALGPANLWVQPVAEMKNGDAAFEDFVDFCVGELAGFDLVDNTESRVKTKRSWAKYRAWHPAKTSDVPSGDPSDCIVVSDCGTIIRALASDGSLEGPGDPAKLQEWASDMVGRGFLATVYYAFWRENNDFPAIDAMGKAGGAVGASPVVVSADEVDFSKLRWTDGAFDGSRAVISAPRISAPAFSARRVDYKWIVGMESWSYADDQADALFCLFVEHPDGTWTGGKFEWVSTSRNWRGLENLFEGEYRRDFSGVENPCRAAIVVVSKDGTKRTPVVCGSWTR